MDGANKKYPKPGHRQAVVVSGFVEQTLYLPTQLTNNQINPFELKLP